MKDRLHLKSIILDTIYRDMSSHASYTQEYRCTLGMLKYNNNSLKTYNLLTNSPYWGMNVCQSIGVKCGGFCDSDSSVKAFTSWMDKVLSCVENRIYIG